MVILENQDSAIFADILLVLDESGSVDEAEYAEQRNWVKELFERFR